MKHLGRAAVWALMIACLLLPPAGSRAAGNTGGKTIPQAVTDAAESLAGLRVLYSLSVPALDDAVYTLWASGTAFAVGAGEGPAAHYVTDASLLDYDAALAAVSKELRAAFHEAGLDSLADTDEKLKDALEVESMEIQLFAAGRARAATVTAAGGGWTLLQISREADAVDAPPLALAEEIPVGDVHYWSAGDAAFGLSEGDAVFPQNFLLLGGTVLGIDGAEISLNNPYSPLSLGSPLLDGKGQAFAVVVGGEDGGVTAVGLAELQKTLTNLGLLSAPETVPAAKNAADDQSLAEKERFHSIVIAATVAAGALLLLILALLLLRARRNRRAQEEEEIIPPPAPVRSAPAPRTAAPGVSPAPPARRAAPAAPAPAADGRYAPSRPQYPSAQSPAVNAAAMPRPQYPANPSPASNGAAPRPQYAAAPASAAGGAAPRPQYAAAAPRPQGSAAGGAPRPQYAAAPSPAAGGASAPPPPSVMLAVLDGRLQGYTLHVADQAVIGRDPKQCKMVFGPTQTEISRRHCAVSYHSATGHVVLEDLNSANGTYTPDGRRFAPGKKYLLRSGDRFFLGVRENMIEVRK